MIIFDLETLADDSHRRHFVDPVKAGAVQFVKIGSNNKYWGYGYENGVMKKFEPDWRAYNEACSDDTPIAPVIGIWNDQISLGAMGNHQIWSGSCESVRKKTEAWLKHHLICFEPNQLKMRPIGDNTPTDQLMERWLDEYLTLPLYPELKKNLPDGTVLRRNDPIDFVFSSDPKTIAMFRRRGVFVFDCAQGGL